MAVTCKADGRLKTHAPRGRFPSLESLSALYQNRAQTSFQKIVDRFTYSVWLWKYAVRSQISCMEKGRRETAFYVISRDPGPSQKVKAAALEVNSH